ASHKVEAEFSGPDPAVLKKLARQVEEYMLKNPHTDKYTVSSDWEPEARTLRAIYNPAAAQRASVNRRDISMAILAATDGLPVTTIYEGDTPYPVRFRIRDKKGHRIEDLNDIPVWPTLPKVSGLLDKDNIMGLTTGAVSTDDLIESAISSVPLSAVTDGVKLGWEEPVVRRRNGQRTIQAQCDPAEGYSPSQVQSELEEYVDKIDLPEGYNLRWVGESELKSDGLKGIISFLPIAGGVMLLTLLLLFNDYRRPLIIILCLPLSVIGIIPGLIFTGQPFSFIAIVGVVGLTGMIIKNAIVLLDEIDMHLKKEITPYQAVVDATIMRVRPVIMASATTILGMIPLLHDPMYASMAVAIIAGLTVGTLITLVFVPLLYSVFFRVKVTSDRKFSN
ncbi:MAG TPA: efflux RND transporter permease subunit, partial [Bacteroidales bacterium]|nr:efflux RND transporter permease subunit [Bacteroidales bacterium]